MSLVTDERRLELALLAFCVLLYVPFAGCYGLWDPWETHYGEIARQMLARGDAISLWWPCSPVDRPEVFHKPVLHFWLLALSMKAFGLAGSGADPAQMVSSWRAEWALRTPNILLSIASVLALFHLVRRLRNARAGLLAALVLATSAQWALVTRQAMTDLPFVAPMTIALALAGIALLSRDAALDEPPSRRAIAALLALVAVCAIVPLAVISAQLSVTVRLGGRALRLAGVVPMLPYWLGAVIAVRSCARVRTRRQVQLLAAWVLCGVATLAKGPAGVALPVLVIAVHLTLSRRWRAIFRETELARGLLLFALVAVPWYHAMTIRHGLPFWNELIGDNYVRRAEGRHGDRGAWDYYLVWAAYGVFPWTGVVLAALVRALGRAAHAAHAHALRLFALSWLAVELTVLTLVVTKFHHYVLAALPALAVLTGLFLDELLGDGDRRGAAWALALCGAPAVLLCGRDLAAHPARLTWLFSYDYVNVPGLGRAWPSTASYGTRFEYGALVTVLVIAAALLTLLLSRARTAVEAPPAIDRWTIAILTGVGLIAAAIVAPSTVNGAPPSPIGLRWLVPAAFAAAMALAMVRTWGRRVMAFALLAVASTSFLLDDLLVEISPHWSQKHVIAAYYTQRRDASEPLVVWELYWRGESFYTQNEIYSAEDRSERTVFLPNDGSAAKLARWLPAHEGRRVFFLVERAKLPGLEALLPPAARARFTLVDKSNNKLVLARTEL